MGERKGGFLLIALLEAAGPVFDGSDHHSHVDEVEFVAVGPGFFDIVYFKGALWERVKVSTVSSKDLGECAWKRWSF